MIRDLSPSTEYEILCIGVSTVGSQQGSHSVTFCTEDARLTIKHVSREESSIFVSIESNTDLPAHCVLYDDTCRDEYSDLCIVVSIDNQPVDPKSSVAHFQFSSDNSLLTKCSILHSDGSC